MNGTPERPEHPPAATATAILSFLDETIGAWELFVHRRGAIDDDGAQLLAIRERAARESSAQSTIAHGFLTLSALAGMTMQIGIVPDGVSQALNYGVERVRFLAPVRSGKRIRAHAVLTAAEKKPGMRILLTVSCTVEIEGEDKPAAVADLLSLMLPDAADAAVAVTPIPAKGANA